MKRLAAALFLSFVSYFSFAQQGKYGFDLGLGYTTFQKSYITPAIQTYWLSRLSRTFYCGGAISFQRYSMQYSSNTSGSSVAFGDVLSIRQKSDYIFFTPRLEMGVGRHKHYFATLSLGPGIYAGGNQWTHQYEPLWYTTSGGAYGVDTAFSNTSYNVPNILFRITAGLKQRIPTFRYWNIVISEELTMLPANLNKKGPEIKTNYLMLSVGIMHKYPSVAAEED
jgi:hypothetical protein